MITWTSVNRAPKRSIHYLHPWEPKPMEKHWNGYRARGRVWQQGTTWFYTVSVGGKVVASDNTSHWKTIFDACNRAVYAFDRVLRFGHTIEESYSSIVDKESRR